MSQLLIYFILGALSQPSYGIIVPILNMDTLVLDDIVNPYYNSLVILNGPHILTQFDINENKEIKMFLS